MRRFTNQYPINQMPSKQRVFIIFKERLDLIYSDILHMSLSIEDQVALSIKQFIPVWNE